MLTMTTTMAFGGRGGPSTFAPGQGWRYPSVTMPSAAHQAQVDLLDRELDEHSRPTNPLRMRQIVAECDARCSVTRDLLLVARWKNTSGRAYARMSDFARAAERFRIAHQLDTRNWVYLTNLAMALVGQGIPEEALETGRRALALPGADVQILPRLHLAAIFQALGRPAEAWDAFDQAHKLADHTDPNVLWLLASCAAQVRDDVSAVRLFASFLAGLKGNGAPVTSPLEFVRAAPRSWLEDVVVTAELYEAIERVSADPVATSLANAREDDEPFDDEDEAALGRTSDRVPSSVVRSQLDR